MNHQLNHLKSTLLPFSFLLLLAIFTTSCDTLFQYNPNEIVLKDSEKDLNNKNLERIKSLPVKDTLRFILMGDTQRWYDESADFVKSANDQHGISFVLHAGDISDFGISQEFKWVNEIMLKLKYPYLTVIGNHDMVANGPIVYARMYGPMNYSFEFGDNKFIFINTNSREYAFDGSVPNLNWLRAQLTNNPSNKNAIVVAHVPPFDADFDPALEKKYASILAGDPNVKFSLYGHQHTFKDGEFYNDSVHYFLTTSMGARGYMVVTTWKGGYKVDRIEY
ncbi:metallophosphoesterase family protein [Dyadobacter psychrotolerans]|uniref:Metallophosphoesterase n=1 Tax=Dyadobacter psychrotolerans TaxID=2541721 RepID=A0A4R5DKK5_9BACT|nr:metallophosphoesterase [Dyadobacter psychrotolerans]TDE14712.1 metallophosphoesterase [Dyadobacter psychrotolerans]